MSEPRHARLRGAVLDTVQRSRETLRRAPKKQRLWPPPCHEGAAAPAPAAPAAAPSPPPRPLSSRLLVPTPHLPAASQSRASVLGPVEWSRSIHLSASRRSEMWVLSSLCVPGGGAGRTAQVSTVHHALKRLARCSSRPPALLGPPGPRSQTSYVAVMEVRPAGGARRKGAAASPGEGGSLPAGGGAACARGTGCAGRRTPGGRVSPGLQPAPGVGGAGG